MSDDHRPGSTARGVLPRAVLWDLDGTLIESEPLWFAQEMELVEEYGGTWSYDDALALVGNPLLTSADYIRAHSPVTLPRDDIVARLQGGVVDAMRAQVPWRPGARELIEELSAAGVPQALVTMSWAAVLEVVLTALPQDTFAAIVTGESVVHGKPHPEPYLTALSSLGVGAAERGRCVAIEDSETGAGSSVAAGLSTLVVPCVKPVTRRLGMVLVDGLDGVRAADLLDRAAPAWADGRVGDRRGDGRAEQSPAR